MPLARWPPGSRRPSKSPSISAQAIGLEKAGDRRSSAIRLPTPGVSPKDPPDSDQTGSAGTEPHGIDPRPVTIRSSA